MGSANGVARANEYRVNGVDDPTDGCDLLC
jgi:hypothetical protein